MRHVASVLAVALVAIGLVALSASANTASAHGNCVQREAGDWTLTGCVSADGAITWTAVDIYGTLYLWSDGQWQVQERPPLPDVDLFPESRTATRAKYGLPTLGKRDEGRIIYSHNLTGSLFTNISVTGTTNNRYFPFGSLNISCSRGGSMDISVSAHALIGSIKYPAQLDTDQEPRVSFESAPPFRWTQPDFSTRSAAVHLSGIAHYFDRDILYEAQLFFQELVTRDNLVVRLPEVDGPITVYFDLDSVFNTPVQHLLERCLGE